MRSRPRLRSKPRPDIIRGRLDLLLCKNFSFLARKMNELWLFEILTSEAQVEVEAKAEVKIEAKYS